MKNLIFIFFLLTFKTIIPTASNNPTKNIETYTDIHGVFDSNQYTNISFGSGPLFTVYQINKSSITDPKRFKVELSLDERPFDPYIISLQIQSWDSIPQISFANATEEKFSKFIPIKITFSNNKGTQVFLIERNTDIIMYDKCNFKNTLKIDQLLTPLTITHRIKKTIKKFMHNIKKNKISKKESDYLIYN